MNKFAHIILCALSCIIILSQSSNAAEEGKRTAEELKVEIISLKEGEKVHGNITIEASVNYPEGVKYCEFYIQEPGAKDRYGWKDYSSPYFWGGDRQTLDTTMFNDGPASAVAFCFAKDAQLAMFQKRVHFIIGNGKPKVKIISPKDGSVIDRTFTITVDANDTKGIQKDAGILAVSFYLDGGLLRRLIKQPFQIELNRCLLTSGRHSIRAVVEDTEGFTGTDAVSIGVSGGELK